MRWKPEFLPDSMWLTQRLCLSVELLIAAILHPVLHACCFWRRENTTTLSHHNEGYECSTPEIKRKKATFEAKDKCEEVQRWGQYCLSKDTLEVIVLNKHLLGEDFHKKELSQSQDVSLFSNWRNYSAVVRHKCFEQSAKITWCTNGTHDWQEK